MKHIIRRWKKILKRYLTQRASLRAGQPSTGVKALRSSMGRYFKYNRPGMAYIIAYDPLYNNAIDSLREEGWQIQLELDATGELFYGVYVKAEEASRHCYIP